MKILFLSPYVYMPEYEEHRKNKTGFGVLVRDIASFVGKAGDDAFLLTRAFGPKRRGDGFVALRRSPVGALIRGRYAGIFQFNAELKRGGVPLRSRWRFLYYFVNLGYVESTIRRLRPDLVHVHGCGVETSRVVEICRKTQTPVAVTLHGLLQHDDFPSEFEKLAEKRFIVQAARENIPISAVSSRIKERVVGSYYRAPTSRNVETILNGVDFSALQGEPYDDLRLKYRIPADGKIVLSVGTICERKNQKQLVEALAKIPTERRRNIYAFFCGDDRSRGIVQARIDELGLSRNVRLLGFVPRERLGAIYAQADLNALTSRDEGFGLGVAEGYASGVPALTFADLDAAADLYDENATFLCRERTDEALADALENALATKWDKEKIKRVGARFSLENIAEKYGDFYRRVSFEFFRNATN